MATDFPTSVDTLTNPSGTDGLDSPSHADQHINANDAIEAIETFLMDGVTVGTFTPSLAGHGSATYTATGRYYKFGKVVFMSIDIDITGNGSGGSTVTVTGGPNIEGTQRQALFSGGYFLVHNAGTDDNTWDKISTTLGGGGYTGGDLTTLSDFHFQGWYELAS